MYLEATKYQLAKAVGILLVPEDTDQAVADAIYELNFDFKNITAKDFEVDAELDAWNVIEPALKGQGSYLARAQAMSHSQKKAFANAVLDLYLLSL